MDNQYKSLPGWTYTSDAFFELEKTELILKNWQLVCHLSNIPKKGNFFTSDIFNNRVFVIRVDNGNVDAYNNFCSHRGTTIRDELSGNCKENIN